MKVKLDPGAKMPTRAHDMDAGYDLYSRTEQWIPPYGSGVFDTGVHIEIPEGFAGVLISKSGLNVKKDLTSTGLIDAGYTGSIVVKLYNHDNKAKRIKAGDKISQLIIITVLTPKLEQVAELEETERGDQGFGSSGE